MPSAFHCPKCHKPGRFLPATSQSAAVDYYRCDDCGQVWSVDKFGRAQDITPRK